VTTSYSYDGDGNQTAMTTANGNTTSYVYDGLGRQVQTIMPPVPVVPAGSGGIGPHLRLGNGRPATAVAWQTTGRPRSTGPATAVAWQTTGRPRSGGARGAAQRHAGLAVAEGQRAIARAVGRHSEGVALDTTTAVIGPPTPPTVAIATVTIPAPGQTTTPASTATSRPATTPASGTTPTATTTPTVTSTATTSPTMTTPTTLPSAIPTGTPGASPTPLPTVSPTASMRATSLITATTGTMTATSGLVPEQLASYGRLPLAFEANQGQTDPRVSYLAHGTGYGLYLTGADAVLALTLPQTPTAPGVSNGDILTQTAPVSETAVRLRYVGASASPATEGQERLPGDANYLLGADPAGWTTAIPTYARVVYHGVYPGIDLAYHGTQGRLEYDWTVAPGASPAAIAFAVDGAQGVSLDAGGNLMLGTAAGPVRLAAPAAYQTIGGARHDVSSSFALTGTNLVAVVVGAYDPTQPLVIDPVLGYSTYLGGGGGNSNGTGIAVDGAGSAYVVGRTNSPSFPQQNAYNGGTFSGAGNDVFVTKLAPDGQSLAYSTYLGGNGDTQGLAIAVGGAGNAYLTGFTWATNYPTTPGAYQTTLGGGNDVFVTELGATGNSLVYSTYLGSGAYETGQALALDGQGHVYLTGYTLFDNLYGAFPTTPGAFQTTFSSQGAPGQGPRSAFLAALDPSKSGTAALLYSTFLGGSGIAQGNGLAVGGQGLVVTGWTSAGSFPTTANALQGPFGSGTTDAFLSVLAPDLSKAPARQLVYSTFLGSGGDTEGAAVAVDASGSLYVVGSTTGGFPATAGAYQRTYGGGGHDAFLARVSMDGGLAYGTYLGGNDDDAATGVAVDGSSNAYVTGDAWSGNFPTTANAFQPTSKGQADAFVAEIGAGLTGTASLVSSSYLGGSNADYGSAIALDSVGNAYLTGQTNSTDFTTLTPYSSTAVGGGTNEAFVTKVGTALLRGTIGTVAGVGGAGAYSGDGGRATAAQLNSPYAVAVDRAGDIFIADYFDGCIREASAVTGVINRVVGTCSQGYSGDGGPAGNAQLNYPAALAFDGAGNLYIADYSNSRVREVLASGGSIGPSSTIVTVAGNGSAGFSGDGGPATQAQLAAPSGIALDSAGNLFIADTWEDRVREVRAGTGIIITVAGTGATGFGGDGGPASAALLHDPSHLATDRAGNLFITDTNNYRVREVRAGSGGIGPSSVITTVVGNGTAAYSGDGGPATAAALSFPQGLVVDSANNLYIADSDNSRVREVVAGPSGLVASGIITTVAGMSVRGYNGDTIPALQADLASPNDRVCEKSG